jgi:hypothetical protein
MKIRIANFFSSGRLKVSLRKIPRQIGYINVLLLICVSFLLYIFVQRYFISISDDFSFIQQNIPNVSYIQLNEAEFKKSYRKYEEKLDGKGERVQNIQSPF